MPGITITSHRDIVEFRQMYGMLLPESLKDDFFDLTIGKKQLVYVDETLLATLRDAKEIRDAEEALLGRTVDRNSKGIIAERSGDIDTAIKLYEENIADGYPATHSYSRLAIIYRKLERFEDELRILDRTIDVYSKENDRRFYLACKMTSDQTILENLQIARETCSQYKNPCSWISYFPYPIFKIIHNREKCLKKIKGKNNG